MAIKRVTIFLKFQISLVRTFEEIKCIYIAEEIPFSTVSFP